MKIIRDPEMKKIFFRDDNKISVSVIEPVPSFLVWELRRDKTSKDPMVVTKDIGKFYDNLDWLMRQDYVFSEVSGKYSSKTDTRLEFMSDQTDPLSYIEGTPRIIIEKKDDKFLISYRVPMEESPSWDNPIRDRYIAFGPAHNGQAADNIVTGDSLQSDMVRLYICTLENRRVTDNKEYVERYNKALLEKQKKGKALGKRLEI